MLHAPCVGRCETAPVAVIGQNPVAHATAEKVLSLVKTGAVEALDVRPAITPGHIDYAAYRPVADTRSQPRASNGERKAADVIAIMEDSGLRGLGGAGFPAGRKWKLVAAEPAPRLMAINIDEGEPGTFKDRYYLERDPHRFLEGAIIAAWAVGIDAVYVYLRDEYHGCRAILERSSPRCRPIRRARFPVSLPPRGGAYICSEESAMIESIEGKRGEPRLRPVCRADRAVRRADARAQHGDAALGRPIVEKGPAWFSGHRQQRTQGTAFVLGERTGEEAGRPPCAGGHHAAGTG